MVKHSEIVVPERPIESDWGEWLLAHPDCDAIYGGLEMPEQKITVFAYATSKKGNPELEKYREKFFSDKKILEGLNANAVGGII